MSKLFKFKQFEVNQERSAMKIGTDGVLLGAWCHVADAYRILDVGCGTGLIALMQAQKNADATIDAVDIDAEAVAEAADNFRASKWAGRLSALCSDFAVYTPGYKYDAIISNPPFFTEAITSPDKRRQAARHHDSLPFDALFSKAAELLTDGGTFSLIAPAALRCDIEFCAGEADFWIKRRTEVRTKATKPAKRILWEFTNIPVSGQFSELILTGDDGTKSDEYFSLTNSFYLY